MTYEELQKIAEDNGYKIKDDEKFLILTKHLENIIKISKSIVNVIFLTISVCLPSDFQMIKASRKYAETPLEERHEEKKYYLKHSFMCGFEKDTFLNVDDLNRAVYLGSNVQSSSIQTQFTQAEIDEIKEKYKTTLDDFEQTEVEE